MNSLIIATEPTKAIPLTQGKFAIVDASDYEWLMQWNWYAIKSKNTYYACRRHVKGQIVLMHRAILNAMPMVEVDHKNGDGLINQRFNLRLCTHQQNMMNKKKYDKSTSQYKGVCWDKAKNKWRSQAMLNRKVYYFGAFKSEIEATLAYNEHIIELFGEFAKINTIP